MLIFFIFNNENIVYYLLNYPVTNTDANNLINIKQVTSEDEYD